MNGAEQWGKTCCDNERSPVKKPQQPLSKQKLNEVCLPYCQSNFKNYL